MEIFSILPIWILTSFLVLFMFIIRRSNRSPMVVPKLPPSPPKLPIIGNLHQLQGKLRHQALWELSEEYGPIMLLHFGSKPFLVISSPIMAKEILKTQDHLFCSRKISKATKRLTYNHLDIAFSPHGNHWREVRKLLVSEFLGPKRARLFSHVLVTEIDTMVSSLMLHPSEDVVNLTEAFSAIVKGLVCKVAFGKNYREQPLDGPSWNVMLDETMEILNGSPGDYFSWFGKLIDSVIGWNAKLEKRFTNLDAYIKTIVDDHCKQTTGEISDHDKDFVDALIELSLKKDANFGYQVTEKDIKALIMDVVIGGINTTAVTMAWTMSEIARSARVMKKLQTEIRNCTGRIEKVDELDVTKMTYLKMVVKEALRMHPPAPLLMPHECLSQCQVGGYDVFPGTSVLINAWGIGRDTRTWGENASEFYPERFENLEVDFGGGINFDMIPFGGGRRICPAINTSCSTIEFTIASLLYWFDWEIPEAVDNEVMDMQEDGSLVVRKKIPLCLVPKKYIWEDE